MCDPRRATGRPVHAVRGCVGAPCCCMHSLHRGCSNACPLPRVVLNSLPLLLRTAHTGCLRPSKATPPYSTTSSSPTTRACIRWSTCSGPWHAWGSSPATKPQAAPQASPFFTPPCNGASPRPPRRVDATRSTCKRHRPAQHTTPRWLSGCPRCCSPLQTIQT